MRTREIACIHYKAEAVCDLGKEGTFYKSCQHCKNYRKGKGKPARTDNRRQKLDRIQRKERWS